MQSEDLEVRIGELERRLRTTRRMLGVVGALGAAACAWVVVSVHGLHSVVSPGDQTVSVREVHLLFGDERDDEFREKAPRITASSLDLGDNRSPSHFHVDTDDTTPLRLQSRNGALAVRTVQSMELELHSGEARVELYAHPTSGPHLGFLGPGGQMDMGTSFLAVGGLAGVVKLEGRDEGTLGVVVKEWPDGAETLLPAR